MSLNFRLANQSDCEPLFAWRTDPETARFSHRQGTFTYSNHMKWFSTVLEDPDRLVIIAVTDVKIGMVRFDRRTPAMVFVSVNLAPEVRGKGYGAPVLIGAESFLNSWAPEVIVAEIRRDNIASRKIFTRAGYAEDPAQLHQPFSRFSKNVNL